ncbi:MAG: SpoIIE family protein phosphatase [Acidobacteriota bacterium]|nr:SpoIIE family protein phosphatase [Acidobacteriota bacterium]
MRRNLLLVVLLLVCCRLGLAQAKAAPTAAAAQDTLVLGDSAVELYGPWRFHTGDDLEWSKPGLDDSHWATMDMTPPDGSADASLGTSGFIPGWTSRGYPGYSGYAWYRLKVRVQSSGGRLALKMPDNADDAYQVYVNGEKIGEFGRFSDRGVTAYSALPRGFRLPTKVRDGEITIAIRMWMDSATRYNSPDAGGMHGPPVLGKATVIASQVQLDWDDTAHQVGSGFLETLILLLALVVATTLFWLDSEEESYRWLGLVSLATLLENAIILMVNFTTAIGQTMAILLSDVVLVPLRIGLWVLFWAYWFRLAQMRRIHQLAWSMMAVLCVGTAMLRPPLHGQVVPLAAGSYVEPLLLAVKLGLAAVLVVVTYRGIRKEKAEGWMALPAVLLAAIANYQRELRLIHVPTAFAVWDFSISLGTISTIVSLLLVTVMLSRRFLHAQRKREQWKLEIEQARNVQQVLIPDQLPEIAGLSILSEYRPAREVGGDFFQIIPCGDQGSVAIVVGDVTGKGVQAGMLVALIVGAIRTEVQHGLQPDRILQAVNDQLCERKHASATCVMLRVDPDGTVVLANAGHLAPYLNGQEMEMMGALPLGTIEGMEYPVETFHMQEGDTLTLMSDGIAEAQNPAGELFGFERVNERMKARISVSDLATEAQNFGQEDDILVLSIQRVSTGPRLPQPEPVLVAS